MNLLKLRGKARCYRMRWAGRRRGASRSCNSRICSSLSNEQAAHARRALASSSLWGGERLARGRRRAGGHSARLALFDDAHLAAELFVIGVAHDHAQVDGLALGKDQLVVGGGVGRKPEFAVDLLAVGFKSGEALLAFGH